MEFLYQGILSFFAYTSVILAKDADEKVKTWQTEATVRELFQSVRSAKETNTPTRTTHHQLSAPGNRDTSELEAIPEPEDGDGSDRDVSLPHTGMYAIRSRCNFSTVFISNEIEENDIFWHWICCHGWEFIFLYKI